MLLSRLSWYSKNLALFIARKSSDRRANARKFLQLFKDALEFMKQPDLLILCRKP